MWQDWSGRAVYRIIIKLAQRNEFNSDGILLPYFCPLLIQIKPEGWTEIHDAIVFFYPATIELYHSWEILYHNLKYAEKREIFHSLACLSVSSISFVICGRRQTQIVYSLLWAIRLLSNQEITWCFKEEYGIRYQHNTAYRVLGFVTYSGSIKSREVLWGVFLDFVSHMVDIS